MRDQSDSHSKSRSGTTYVTQKLASIESFREFAKGHAMPAWPIEIFLEISNVCNLKCAMCTTFSALNPYRLVALKAEERGFIDTEAVQRSLHELLEHALNVHCFGYGEPTIHPDFRNLVSWLAQYEVLIDFFTNGMHLNDDLSEFLVESGVHKINVSFSGVTKQEYENVYIGGVFERVLAGIESLARVKSRRGSCYPVIHINSLAWEHHVSKIDQFVHLMADHGANVIHLKSLLQHEFIPQLRGHSSIFRPWIEGPILERAREIAQQRGVVFSAEQYEANAARSEEDWIAQKQFPTKQGVGDPDQSLVEIGRFKQDVRDVKFVQDTSSPGRAEVADSTQLSREELSRKLDIRVPDGARDRFYCFEPFKTLYVRRDGTVKPCCFSANDAHRYGDVAAQSGTEIWNGEVYSLVRRSILNGEYPLASCGHCLKGRIGPQHHFTNGQIREYELWCKAVLGYDLDPKVADEMSLLGGNAEIAERFNKEHFAQGTDVAELGIEGQSAVSDKLRDILRQVEMRQRRGEACADLIMGHVDRIDATLLYGWAFSPASPESRIEVEVISGGRIIQTLIADRYREDLLSAGIHDGYHAFEVVPPKDLSNEELLSLSVRVAGTMYSLQMPGFRPNKDSSHINTERENSSLDICERFATWIQSDIPFSFSRYGDGEYICAFEEWSQYGGANIDNDPYTPKLSEALRESFKYMANIRNAYIGEWPKAVPSWESLTSARARWVPYETLLINGFSNDKKLSIYKAIKESSKKKIVVCNESLVKSKALLNADHLVLVPFNNWFDTGFADVLHRISSLIREDGNHILITCAGMSSKVLICELVKRFPKGTYLDVGSCLDVLCTGRKTRSGQLEYAYFEDLFKELLPDNWNQSKVSHAR
jgi:MoaA/NifB/PqqE/SkfB family radical SAM enzyme